MSQPAVVLLPWVPATATRLRPCGRVGDDLLPRLGRDPSARGRTQLRVVRGDRRERLGDGEAVEPRAVGDVRRRGGTRRWGSAGASRAGV